MSGPRFAALGIARRSHFIRKTDSKTFESQDDCPLPHTVACTRTLCGTGIGVRSLSYGPHTPLRHSKIRTTERREHLRAGNRPRNAPSLNRTAGRSAPLRAGDRHRSAPHGRTAGAAKGAASSPAGSCGSRRLAAAPPRRHTLRRPTRAASAPTRRCAGQHQHPERKQPPTLRQHRGQEPPQGRAAHALPAPLPTLLDRHHGQRTRDRREPPLRALCGPHRRKHLRPTGTGLRSGRQLVRTRGQQHPCAHARAGRAARPAVPHRRPCGPRAPGPQQAAAALARLPLRCGHRADTRSAGHLRGTRRGAHARQLDHQCRRLVPGARTHDVRSLRRQHPRHGQQIAAEHLFRSPRLRIRRVHRRVRDPQPAGNVLHGGFLGGPQLLRIGAARGAAQGVHPPHRSTTA